MRPAQVLRQAADYLARHDVESPFPTAEVLLAAVLGTDRAGLYARDEGLSTAEAKRFGRTLCRRCVGTPLQHITGVQAFRRLTLIVRPGVFIPRPETEVVVEHALAVVAGMTAPLVVDVGTGTGAIALAMKDEHPDVRVMAIDRSPAAVELALANAQRLELEVEVLLGDLLDPIPDVLRGSVDLVVSNPPYIPIEEVPALTTEVRADPAQALIGGIEVFDRLFGQTAGMLRPGGAVVVEIGDTQGEAVTAAAERAGLVRIETHEDLTGRDRVVSAWLQDG
jgi:release factor glutamine methyltransferase